MKILAIDTSCDDTAVAVVDDLQILSNVVSSQVRFHKKFGGVVPFLAQRLHKERIDNIVTLALQRAGVTMSDLDSVAVTEGPGLAPALQVGIATAKDLSATHALPLYAVNHMAGHIASCFAKNQEIHYPFVTFLVSGGHTELVLVRSFTDREIIGQTLDDSVGEAFDKVARMLGLGYPGAKLLCQMAKEGDSTKYELPIPLRYRKDLNFSYSGLKNAVRLLILSIKEDNNSEYLSEQQIKDVSASFQEVALIALQIKLERALKQYEVKQVLLAGGVAANMELRKKLRATCKKYGVNLVVPPTLKLCNDNAAMIGLAAVLGIAEGQQPVDLEQLDRKPALSLS